MGVSYIPRNMHVIRILLIFVVVRYRLSLPIFFRITPLPLRQSCSSASETVLTQIVRASHVGLRIKYITTIKHMHRNKTICIFYMIYCRLSTLAVINDMIHVPKVLLDILSLSPPAVENIVGDYALKHLFLGKLTIASQTTNSTDYSLSHGHNGW